MSDLTAVLSLPEMLGEYRILSLLGEGGMGQVYEAEQQRPRRLVALKVIRAGLASKEVLWRFEHESVVLGRLQHPGIAQVHEAGTFDLPGGLKQPYFAMELVRGVPLTRYAQERGLELRERLELVVKICDAVQHAHQRGIIHRDLKPENILVDAEGQPKILDFGVARITDSDVQSVTMHTDIGQIVGTLPYMSPEQASGRPEELDTRSDVYALGVITYELLAGKLPYDLQKQMLHDAIRIIREEEPERLSTTNRSLRGDVETIVSKALEKDKLRRYQSAGEMGTDIQRFLRFEAITARPAGTWYQLSKFARRNRVFVGGCAATFLALAAGFLVSTMQFVKAAEARDLAEERRKSAEEARAAEEKQRSLANLNEERVRAINGFLLDMLRSGSLREMGRDATIAQAIAGASSKISSAFGSNPNEELAIRQAIAETYLSLGMIDEAEEHVTRALELATTVEGIPEDNVLVCFQLRAALENERGELQESLATLDVALLRAKQSFAEDSNRVRKLRLARALTLRELGEMDEAEEIYRDLLEEGEQFAIKDPQEYQVLLNSLAVLLHHQDRKEEAISLYQQAAAFGQTKWGAENADTLVARFNLASAELSMGREAAAEEQMTELVPLFREVFGPQHPQTSRAVEQLGRLYKLRGRPKEALPLLQEALEIFSRIHREETIDILELKGRIASVLRDLAQYEEAIAMIREIIPGYVRLRGEESENALIARSNLAECFMAAEQDQEAEEIYLELVELVPQALGESHKQSVIIHNSFGVLLMKQKRIEEAIEYMERALAALVRFYPPEDRDTAITTHNLMWAISESGRNEDAAAQVEALIERFELAFGPKHPSTAHAKHSGAWMLSKVDRWEEAEQLYQSAADMRAATLGTQHPLYADSVRELGSVKVQRGELAAALALLEEANAIFDQLPTKEPRAACRMRGALGECLARMKRFAAAEPLLQESYRISDSMAERRSELVEASTKRLAELYAAWQAEEPSAERAQLAAEWQAKLEALAEKK